MNIEPEKLNEVEFKGMLTDILLGMAAGLRRDPTVILRMEGDDLLEYISSQSFESEAVWIFSQIVAPNMSIRDYLVSAFGKLTVDHGMPPTSDPWVLLPHSSHEPHIECLVHFDIVANLLFVFFQVMCNVVKPVLECFNDEEYDLPISRETFLMAFKKAASNVAQILKTQPVIVAHNENIFDGNGIKRLLSNKFELDKVQNHIFISISYRKIPNKLLIIYFSSGIAGSQLSFAGHSS